MRSTGKTKLQIKMIAEVLNKKDSVFVYWLQHQQVSRYVDTLWREYGIIVTTIPKYAENTTILSKFLDFEIKKYDPLLIGYEFRNPYLE